MFPLLFHSSHTAGSQRLHPAHRKWSLCFEKRQERGSYLSNTGNASGQTWHNVVTGHQKATERCTRYISTLIQRGR